MAQPSLSGQIQTREEIAREIKAIIAEVIDVDFDRLDPDADFVDTLGVDSLLALEVVAALENRFHFEVPEENLADFTSVNKVIEMAWQRLSGASGGE